MGLPFFGEYLRESEIEEFVKFSALIQEFQTVPSHSNARVWSLSSSGVFSVSSFFAAISSTPTASPFRHRIICFPLSPSKVQAFLWKIAQNRGPTLDVIQSFHLHLTRLPNHCPLCLLAAETNVHLFLHCPLAGGCEGNLLTLVNHSLAVPGTFSHLGGRSIKQDPEDGCISMPYMSVKEGAKQTLHQKSRWIFFKDLGVFLLFASQLS